MPISFGNIPPDVLLPLFYAEITPAQEPWSPALKLCLIGSANQAEPGGFHYEEGSGLSNVPYLLSGTLATELFGRGSMLARMYTYARSNAPFAEIWGCALPSTLDDANPLNNAFRSKGKIYVYNGGTKTRFGTAAFHIEGVPISFSVQKTRTRRSLRSLHPGGCQRRQAAWALASINQTGPRATATTHPAALCCSPPYPGLVGNNIAVTYVGCFGRCEPPTPQRHHRPNSASRSTRWQCSTTAPVSTRQPPATRSAGPSVRRVRRPATGVTTSSTPAKTSWTTPPAAGLPTGRCMGTRYWVVTPTWQNTYDYLAIEQTRTCRSSPSRTRCIPEWLLGVGSGRACATHWSAPPELSRPLQTLELRNTCVGSDDDESFTRVEKQTLLNRAAPPSRWTTTTCPHRPRAHAAQIQRLRRPRSFVGRRHHHVPGAIFCASRCARASRVPTRAAPCRRCPTGINGFTSPVEIRTLIIHEYKRQAPSGWWRTSTCSRAT